MQDSAQHRIRSINDNGPAHCQASLVAHTVKYLPAMQETRVQSLGQEDPLEKWPPTQVFLPRESLGQRSLVVYSPRGYRELGTT